MVPYVSCATGTVCTVADVRTVCNTSRFPLPQHADRVMFRTLMEDKTALKLDPMMRVVLENTHSPALNADSTSAGAAGTGAAGTSRGQDKGKGDCAGAHGVKRKKGTTKSARPSDLLH
jgi:hypothetical protein